MLEVKHCLKKIPIQSPYENHNSFKGKSFTLHYQAVLKKLTTHFYLHVSGGAKYSVWNDIQLKR